MKGKWDGTPYFSLMGPGARDNVSELVHLGWAAGRRAPFPGASQGPSIVKAETAEQLRASLPAARVGAARFVFAHGRLVACWISAPLPSLAFSLFPRAVFRLLLFSYFIPFSLSTFFLVARPFLLTLGGVCGSSLLVGERSWL